MPVHEDRRRDDNGHDYRSQRRNGTVVGDTATWVRWAILIMVTAAVSALGFVVNLSNRQAVAEARADARAEQAIEVRTETNKNVRDLTEEVSRLTLEVTRMRTQLDAATKDPPLRRVPSRMFDR